MATRKISGTVRRIDENEPIFVRNRGYQQGDPMQRALDAAAQRATLGAERMQTQAANRALVNQQALQRLVGGTPSQLTKQAEGRVLGSRLISGKPLSPEQQDRLGIRRVGEGNTFALVGGGGGGGLSASDLAKMQWEQVKRNWELEDRAFELAQRQAQSDQETAAGQRQRTAYENIADLYRTQGEGEYNTALQDIADIYGGQRGEADRRREAALASLAGAVEQAGGQIDAATAEALQNLIATQAYSDVPLVELSPMQNLFTQALQAEGASMAGVEQQRAQDEALARQFAQLQRGAAQQLNVGEQNYLTALRNALTGGQAAGRSAVASRAAAERGSLESQYANLVSQIAAAEADAKAEAERRRRDAILRAAEAMAQAEQYAPADAPAEDWTQYFR